MVMFTMLQGLLACLAHLKLLLELLDLSLSIPNLTNLICNDSGPLIHVFNELLRKRGVHLLETSDLSQCLL